jgi:hypothetical protein
MTTGRMRLLELHLSIYPKSLASFLLDATVSVRVMWRDRSWEVRFTGGR